MVLKGVQWSCICRACVCFVAEEGLHAHWQASAISRVIGIEKGEQVCDHAVVGEIISVLDSVVCLVAVCCDTAEGREPLCCCRLNHLQRCSLGGFVFLFLHLTQPCH